MRFALFIGRYFKYITLNLIVFGLVACGGGGGSTEDVNIPRSPTELVRTETAPAGARIDLQGSNYFPYSEGDVWRYLVYSATQSEPVYEVVKYESMVDYFELPLKARSIIFPIVEYPQPFYPIGQLRTVFRSGGWGEDLDGDQVEEGFKFTFTQVFRGTESISVSGKTITVAHFSNTSTVEIIPSDKDYSNVINIMTEEAYFAPNFGLVKHIGEMKDQDGKVVEPLATRILHAATVSGRDWQESLLDGTLKLVDLKHKDLVFDKLRTRYYASLPADGTFTGGLAIINSSSGAIERILPVLGEPGPMALSADSQFLYVGLDQSSQLMKVDVAQFREVQRAAIGSQRVLGIAVSPVNPEIVAVIRTDLCFGCSGGDTDGIVLFKSMVLQPKVSFNYYYNASLIKFDSTGDFVYSFDSLSTAHSFLRHRVLQDGLEQNEILNSLGLSWSSDMWVDGDELGIGNKIYSLSRGVFIRSIPDSLIECTYMSFGRVACIDSIQSPPIQWQSPMRLVLIDRGSGNVIARPSFYKHQSFTDMRILSGSSGQIAVSERLDGMTHRTRIWLYDSPLLNP